MLRPIEADRVVAEATSPQGRRVELLAGRLGHICANHVELQGELDLVVRAISTPDLQEPDLRPGRERYFLRTSPPFPFPWLRVVVEFAGSADRVVTAFGQSDSPEATA